MMSGRPLSIALLVLAPTLVWPATLAAQMPGGQVEQMREVRFQDQRPVALFAVENDYSPGRPGAWALTAIYAVPLTEPRASVPVDRYYWVARRLSGVGDAVSDAPTWADSRISPPLEGAVWWASRLIVPSLDITGMTSRQPRDGGPPRQLALHSPRYTLWGTGTQPDALPAQVTVSASWGMIADWGQTTERNLRDCWTPDEPLPRGRL